MTALDMDALEAAARAVIKARASDRLAPDGEWYAYIRVASPEAALALIARVRRAEAALRDALRYRYLRDHCGWHHPMTHQRPAEWSISWEFQQVRPEHATGTFDSWIDACILRLDEEDRAALEGRADG